MAMAWKGQWRKRLQREDPDLQHLGARIELSAVDEQRPVGDPDHAVRVPLGDVIDADQRRELDRGADLLHALAHRRVGGMLVSVDEATWQAPQPVTGLDRATAQDHAPVDLDNDGSSHLGVVPQDEVVVRARLQLTAFDDSSLEQRSAANTVVGHAPRGYACRCCLAGAARYLMPNRA